MNLLPVLQQHLSQYPAMTAQDCVKLIYQAVLGPAHLGRKSTPQPAYIANEMANSPRRDVPLWENIGNGLCRFHLDSTANHLRPETIHGLFMATAQKHHGSLEHLKEQLALWQTAHTYPEEDVAVELKKLEESNYAPVSHSEPYHQAYDPHYRLIREELLRYIPLLERIDSRLQAGERTLLAIDGRCASGKSSLSALLESIYGCPVIHMDDFFLPFERKTPERLAEPGGNVDRERFYMEVILPYSVGESFSYGVYDCSEGTIRHSQSIESAPLTIVEGSYCLHPMMADAYDLKVFSTCQPQLQSERILQRDGAELHRCFIEEWIPMEEQYFAAFEIPTNCDFIFETDDL